MDFRVGKRASAVAAGAAKKAAGAPRLSGLGGVVKAGRGTEAAASATAMRETAAARREQTAELVAAQSKTTQAALEAAAARLAARAPWLELASLYTKASAVVGIKCARSGGVRCCFVCAPIPGAGREGGLNRSGQGRSGC